MEHKEPLPGTQGALPANRRPPGNRTTQARRDLNEVVARLLTTGDADTIRGFANLVERQADLSGDRKTTDAMRELVRFAREVADRKEDAGA